MHYAGLLQAGFKLDYNDFTILEQKYITYAYNKIKYSNKDKEIKLWADFFKKGFEAVCKQISRIRI